MAKRPAGRPKKIEGEVLAIGGEMIRSGSAISAGGVYFLPLDDIIRKKGWSTYRELRVDDQVKAALNFKKVLVGGRNYEIKPALDGERKRREREQMDLKEKEEEEAAAAAQAEKEEADREAMAKGAAADAKLAPKPGAAPPKKKFAEEEDDDKEAVSKGGKTDALGNPLPRGAKPDVSEEDIEKAEQIARFVEENLNRLNFRHIIREALTAFDYGFSVGELVWETQEFEGERKIFLKAIKHRDPESIEIKQDGHGNVKGYRQTSIGRVVEVGPEKVWHYAHQSEFGNAYGISDLRSAYRSWWAKKFIINFWNVFLERMGQPLTMMKYPQGASSELKETLKGILTSLSMKAEILVPMGVEVELVEATRTGTAKYEEALAYHDRAIARSLLMIGLIGLSAESQQSGAESQSRLQLRMLFKMADELSQELAFTFTEQVLKPLVDMNFDHDNLYPEFLWQDYGAFEGNEVADTIRQLHAAGILDMDQNDVNYVRSVLGLSLREEGDVPDEVQRPQTALPPPGNANTPPPAAPQNNARAEKGSGASRKTEPGSGAEKK